jgi:copper chaperone NosL
MMLSAPITTVKTMSRIIIVVGALLLGVTYYLPLWHIGLAAPQYPEGLGLDIYINRIAGANPGDLQKINSLNHYIGMKKIEPDSIPELSIMPWIMRGILIFGIIVALVGRRWLLLVWIVIFALMALAGFYDYYKWGYDYGHNLDMENAIIKVPGMSYQPPLIGQKKLLNFTATSLPGAGGWVAMVSFLVYVAVWWTEYRREKKRRKGYVSPRMAVANVMLVGLAAVVFNSCSVSEPEAVRYGEDACAYCKMTIMDKSFAAALLTTKGKTYKFDSIECLAGFHLTERVPKEQIHSNWVTNYSSPGQLIDVSSAFLVQSERIRSPMGVGLLAFSVEKDARSFADSIEGEMLTWEEVLDRVQQAWLK